MSAPNSLGKLYLAATAAINIKLQYDFVVGHIGFEPDPRALHDFLIIVSDVPPKSWTRRGRLTVFSLAGFQRAGSRRKHEIIERG